MTIKRKEEGGIVVLLVEDDAAHAELVRYCFEDQDVDIDLRHLDDGEKALQYLNREGPYIDDDSAPMPHLVLLDLRLPRVDGLQVLAEIKSLDSWSRIPVVVLTTSQAEADIAKAYAHHANSYCVKPVDFANFEGLLNDLGIYWLSWNKNGGTACSAV